MPTSVLPFGKALERSENSKILWLDEILVHYNPDAVVYG